MGHWGLGLGLALNIEKINRKSTDQCRTRFPELPHTTGTLLTSSVYSQQQLSPFLPGKLSLGVEKHLLSTCCVQRRLYFHLPETSIVSCRGEWTVTLSHGRKMFLLGQQVLLGESFTR